MTNTAKDYLLSLTRTWTTALGTGEMVQRPRSIRIPPGATLGLQSSDSCLVMSETRVREVMLQVRVPHDASRARSKWRFGYSSIKPGNKRFRACASRVSRHIRPHAGGEFLGGIRPHGMVRCVQIRVEPRRYCTSERWIRDKLAYRNPEVSRARGPP